MKKFITSLLVIAILFTFTACGSNKSENAGSSTAQTSGVVNMDKKLDIEMMSWGNVKPTGEDEVYKFLEKKFNISLKYSSVPNADYSNFVNMRIASGDLPTIFKIAAPDAAPMTMYRQLVADKLIINISDYVKKYNFVNLAKQLDAPQAKLFSEKDGFYMIPNYLGPDLAGLYVRQDWMEKLNLTVPKTYDDFKNMLREIVKSDLDKKGTTGLTIAGTAPLEQILTAFTGTSGEWVQLDGKWTHKVLLPKFKEGLKYIAGLYSEKLIDQEFAIINTTSSQAKLTSGKAATLIMNGTVAWLTPVESALKAYDPNAKLSLLVPWPAGPAGAVKGGGSGYYGAMQISSAATEDERTRVLSMLDYMLGEEGTDLFFYGVEGTDYTMVDGKKVINEDAKKKDFAGLPMYPFYDVINNASQWKFATNKILLANREFAKTAGISPLVVGLATEKTADIGPRMTDVYQKWLVNFVTGKANIDTQWDEFITEFKAAGYDDYLKEVETYMSSK